MYANMQTSEEFVRQHHVGPHTKSDICVGFDVLQSASRVEFAAQENEREGGPGRNVWPTDSRLNLVWHTAVLML